MEGLPTQLLCGQVNHCLFNGLMIAGEGQSMDSQQEAGTKLERYRCFKDMFAATTAYK